MECQSSAASQAGSGKRHGLHSLMFCKPTQFPPPSCWSSLHPAREKPEVAKEGVETKLEADLVRCSVRTHHTGTSKDPVLHFQEGVISSRCCSVCGWARISFPGFHRIIAGQLLWVTSLLAGNSHIGNLEKEKFWWEAEWKEHWT